MPGQPTQKWPFWADATCGSRGVGPRSYKNELICPTTIHVCNMFPWLEKRTWVETESGSSCPFQRSWFRAPSTPNTVLKDHKTSISSESKRQKICDLQRNEVKSPCQTQWRPKGAFWPSFSLPSRSIWSANKPQVSKPLQKSSVMTRSSTRLR